MNPNSQTPSTPEEGLVRECYLLYLDVLGFRALVQTDTKKIESVFEIIASLNAHQHGAFRGIAFSDTVVIHNAGEPGSDSDREAIVMYQCEFFRDLVHRLAGRDVFLRGALVAGTFVHYQLNGTPVFYGTALVRAYDAQREKQVTGLLMDENCLRHNKVFSTQPWGEGLHYTFVTQGLDALEGDWAGGIGIPKRAMEELDLAWDVGPEIETLRASEMLAKQHSDADVREKHEKTLALFQKRYPQAFEGLKSADFRMEAICPEYDWAPVRERMSESYSWAAERGPARPAFRKADEK